MPYLHTIVLITMKKLFKFIFIESGNFWKNLTYQQIFYVSNLIKIRNISQDGKMKVYVK